MLTSGAGAAQPTTIRSCGVLEPCFEPVTSTLTSYVPLVPAANDAVDPAVGLSMKSMPGAVPVGGAMLQLYEYVCAKRAGHVAGSSSSEKSALTGRASSECGSNGRPAVVSA